MRAIGTLLPDLTDGTGKMRGPLATLDALFPSSSPSVLKSLRKWRLTSQYGPPVSVMKRDWDNLFILDACRYDAFQQANSIAGDLQPVVSSGSHSKGFLRENFSGEYHDTVYVTANGWAHEVANGTFHDTVYTYSQQYAGDEHWDRHRNLSPEHVYDVASEAYANHKDKRFIIHFMQPHAPYFGEKAKRLREEMSDTHGIGFKAWMSPDDPDNRRLKNNLKTVAREGLISDTELWEVYMENLELVLTYTEKLLEDIGGKTVITADHGEMLGSPTAKIFPLRQENKYGHTERLYIPELRVVPWCVVDSSERRDITADPPASSEEISQHAVDDQLTALGYK
jgi:hypothetical protein